MARGRGWWGTGPLVVGASGLLLLAFGAKWLPGDEINDQARAEAEKIEEGVRAEDPRAREAAAEILQKADKLPAAEDGQEAHADRAVRLRDRLYQALTYRDPGAVIAGRLAFYGGLVLVFAAGVLLYRRRRRATAGRGKWSGPSRKRERRSFPPSLPSAALSVRHTACLSIS